MSSQCNSAQVEWKDGVKTREYTGAGQRQVQQNLWIFLQPVNTLDATTKKFRFYFKALRLVASQRQKRVRASGQRCRSKSASKENMFLSQNLYKEKRKLSKCWFRISVKRLRQNSKISKNDLGVQIRNLMRTKRYMSVCTGDCIGLAVTEGFWFELALTHKTGTRG